MGTSLDLLATLKAVEALLLARTGLDCAPQRPNDNDLLAGASQTSVTGDDLQRGVARALTEMQRTYRVSILFQLPSPDTLNPEVIVKALVRFAAAKRVPEMPRKEEWKVDSELSNGIQLAYHEFVLGVIAARCEKARVPTVQVQVPPEVIDVIRKQMIYGVHMTRPTVVRLVHEAMVSLPPDRHNAFLELLLAQLGSVDPTLPGESDAYRTCIQRCASLVRPAPVGTTKLN